MLRKRNENMEETSGVPVAGQQPPVINQQAPVVNQQAPIASQPAAAGETIVGGTNSATPVSPQNNPETIPLAENQSASRAEQNPASPVVPQPENAADSQTEQSNQPTSPDVVRVKIKREHLEFPHSIEMRRNGGDYFIEARTQDHRHTQTIGAKTIEQIIMENGAPLPSGEEEVIEITLSPYNGEVVAIMPVVVMVKETILVPETVQTDARIVS